MALYINTSLAFPDAVAKSHQTVIARSESASDAAISWVRKAVAPGDCRGRLGSLAMTYPSIHQNQVDLELKASITKEGHQLT